MHNVLLDAHQHVLHATPKQTPAPPPENDAILGICTAFNDYFIIYLVISAALFLAMMITWKLKLRGPAKGTLDYGRPWPVIELFWAIAFWNTAPIIVFFIIWKDIMPEFFKNTNAMACVSMAGFPIFPVFFAFQGLIFMFLYRPEGSVNELSTRIANDVTAEKVKDKNSNGLMVSSSCRGMVYVRTAQKLMRDDPNARLTFVDMGSAGRFCKESAATLDANEPLPSGSLADAVLFVELGPERPHHRASDDAAHAQVNVDAEREEGTSLLQPTNNMSSGSNVPFAIPASDETFNYAVIPPYFRNMPQLGGFMGSPLKSQQRVRAVLIEVFRVLKPGAPVFVYDGVEPVLFTFNDLNNVGFEVSQEASAANMIFATLIFFRIPLFTACARKPQKPEALTTNHVKMQEALLGSFAMSAASPTCDKAEAEHRVASRMNKTHMAIIVGAWQTLFFVLLNFVAAGLYEPLNYPKNIVIGQRINNILPSIATNYLMVGYFERQLLLSESHFHGWQHALSKIIPSDGISCVITVFLSALLFIPTFAIQVALNSTSLSDSAKGLIGIAISIVIGFVMYKLGQKKLKKKALDVNGLTQDDVEKVKKAK